MTVSLLPEFAIAFVLVFARIGTMMMLVPGLAERTTPVRVRVGLAVLVVFLVLPFVRAGMPKTLQDLPMVVRLLIGELLVGFTLGLSARFMMSSLQTAGVLIAQQMSLAFTMTLDPTHGDQGQSASISNFLLLLAISLILATNLHHVALMGIVDSYRSFAPGQVPETGDAAELALSIAAMSFAVGLKLSAPFLVFGLVFNVGLGILSRMMPQLQVFFLAMPASILLGTIIFMLVLSLMMDGFLQSAARVLSTVFPGAS
ncbi:MAG: flagellar type III secretion system protein FliR [Proteobacteria bacterium]|nr:flagellar type III secretion system protein FliR [Pseudomonadota bacterium]